MIKPQKFISKLKKQLLNTHFAITKVSKGRFPDEVSFEIAYIHSGMPYPIIEGRFFGGRQPFYRPWIELFNYNLEVKVGSGVIKLWNTMEEYKLLDILSSQIPPGSSLIISYINDIETFKALGLGVPPPITRLGYILLNLGYTWFKDLYFSEGFGTEEQKLQAQRPVDEAHLIMNVKEIIKEVNEFEKNVKDRNNPIILNALRRCVEVRRILSKYV